MTVANSDSSVVHVGNGVSVNFPYSFRIPDPSYVKISIRDHTTHLVTRVLDLGDYTITGTTWTNYSGGIVTYSPAISSSQEIVIERIVTIDQELDINNQGGFYADSIEQSFDKLTMIAQEQAANLVRAIVAPVGESVPPLPSLSGADGKVIGYSNGQLVWAANDAAAVAADVAAAAASATTAEEEAAAAVVSAAEAQTALTTVQLILPGRVTKTNSTSVVSSTTLITDPDLVVPLGANSLLLLRGVIKYSASATGDIKWQYSGPAGFIDIQLERRARAPGATVYSNIAGDVAYSSGDIVVDGGTGVGLIEFEATIQNGVTAGDFVIKFAQNVSDGTATIFKVGSYIEYIPLPTSADFAFTSTAIAKLGDYSGPISAGGHNVIAFYQPSGISNSYAEVMLTGTDAEAQLFAGDYTITVDGVASTITAPAGWTFVSLFPTGADVERRVRVKGVSIDSDITFRVSGTAPNCTRPPDITNYFRIFDPAYAAYISKDGALDDFTGLYGGSVGTAYTTTACGEGHRFSATTTRVDAWLYCTATSSPVELLQDGVSLGVITLPVLGTMERVTLATGLSGAHEYEIRPTLANDSFYCFAIMVDTLTASAHANKSLYAGYGDSNMQMQPGEDARTHWLYLLAKRRGWANVRRGVGGQSISTWGRDNTALVTSGLSQAADCIITMLGVNDYYFSVALATVQADCTTMLANLRSGNASAPIVAIGIHDHYRAQADSTPYSNTTRAAYNAKIQAAVAARFAAGDHNVFYIDPTGWINVTPGVNLRDSVHLNAAGFIAFEAGLNTALVALGL